MSEILPEYLPRMLKRREAAMRATPEGRALPGLVATAMAEGLTLVGFQQRARANLAAQGATVKPAAPAAAKPPRVASPPRSAEENRVHAIVGSPEFLTHPALAKAALEDGLTDTQFRAVAKVVRPQKKNALERAMDDQRAGEAQARAEADPFAQHNVEAVYRRRAEAAKAKKR